jgi:hypothetical protein
MTSEEMLAQMPTLEEITAQAGALYHALLRSTGETEASSAADRLIAAWTAQKRLYKNGLRRVPTDQEIEIVLSRM